MRHWNIVEALEKNRAAKNTSTYAGKIEKNET